MAMLMVCVFSACSQDDDLFEYDLGKDEAATLAKRSMPRNGEAIIPPTPPKEDEEDVPRRIELGSADFYEVRSIPVLLFDNMGTPFFTSRPGGIGGTITVFAVEEGNNQPAHFDASLSFDGEDLKGNIAQISRPQRGIISVEFIAYIYNDVLDDIDKINNLMFNFHDEITSPDLIIVLTSSSIKRIEKAVELAKKYNLKILISGANYLKND